MITSQLIVKVTHFFFFLSSGSKPRLEFCLFSLEILYLLEIFQVPLFQREDHRAAHLIEKAGQRSHVNCAIVQGVDVDPGCGV